MDQAVRTQIYLGGGGAAAAHMEGFPAATHTSDGTSTKHTKKKTFHHMMLTKQLFHLKRK